MAKTRRGTCDGCGKVRKLTYPEKKNTREHPRILGPDEEIHYYGLCSECFPKVKTQADIRALRKARDPKEKKRYRKAYPCIGGPLDGLNAATEDMYPRVVARRDSGQWKEGDVIREGGMYGHVADEYEAYNSAGHGRHASMIFVHTSLLRQVVSARVR